MRQRIPGYILIPTVLMFVIVILMMVTPASFEVRDAQENFWGFISDTMRHMVNVLSDTLNLGVVIISFFLLLIINSINALIEKQRVAQLSAEEKARYLEASKGSYFKRVWQSAYKKQSAEEEQEILIDHGYDGITELDNSLPRWWLALFYATVIYTIVYAFAFFYAGFADQEVEYATEVEEWDEKIKVWVEENDITIDEANNAFEDSQAMAKGEQIFKTHCVTCHTESGGGGIGPNLTDGNWVSKVDDDLFRNIYNIVYNGSPTNPQMVAWGTGPTRKLNGWDVQDVASYVYYLNQVAPEVSEANGGAAPQGDLIPEWTRGGGGAAAAPAQPETPEGEQAEEVEAEAGTDEESSNDEE